MAKFSTAARVISTVGDMKLVDLPRSSNRALIDNLYNGLPPYTAAEVENNRIDVNVNFLDATNLAHQARRQFSGAFLSPENFFSVKVDYGPAHKRTEWSESITMRLNKFMKRSRIYREELRNVFGQLVLHGVGPMIWDGKQQWCPEMMLMGDVLLPSHTLLTLKNVEYFGVFRRYTATQLWAKTHGPKVDKAWNVPLAEKCVQWAAKQYGKTNSSYDQVWSPEKVAEDIKSDSCYYASDAVPTIDCWDFYFKNDENKQTGWNRRIVLDTPSDVGETIPVTAEDKNQFLFDSGERKFADNLDQIIHFQFADGSSVAPFRYHSVRSLGYLLYSVCHLQNRLRCRLNEHAFENLIQYLRCANPDDAERMTKMDLINRGIVPDGVTFVTQQERWQVNQPLIESVMAMNRQSMSEQSASYTQDFDFDRERKEKTATEVNAEVNATTALVGAMLQEAYGYQEFQYREIARRFCIKNSSDKDVRAFRAGCLRDGIPEDVLNSECWDINAVRVMGSGNRQQALQESSMLMQSYPLYSPTAQQVILRQHTFAVTNDPALTKELVPYLQNSISDSVSFAQTSVGTLMLGLPVEPKPGSNNIEIVETWLGALTMLVKATEQAGGMTTPEKLGGMANIATHISKLVALIAQDKNEKSRVKQYGDDLGQLQNMLKAYGQRLAEQQQSSQTEGAPADPKAAAQAQAIVIQAQTKAKISEESHAQKTKQREESANLKRQQQEEAHKLQLASQIRQAQVGEAATDIKTAAEIKRETARAAAEPKEPAAEKP